MNWELFYLINKSVIDFYALAATYAAIFMMLIFMIGIIREDFDFIAEL
jgi:hypothetical protein